MGLFDRLRKRRPTAEQLERLSRIKNEKQRVALLRAIERGEGIPDYAWTPLPEELDPERLVKDVMMTEPGLRRDVAADGTPDLGLEAVDFLSESMEVDEEWSLREPRGFTWWPHRLRQRVWVDPGREDDGFQVFRLHAVTDLLRNVPASLDTARRLSLVNKFASLSAFTWDPEAGRVSLLLLGVRPRRYGRMGQASFLECGRNTSG